MKKDTHPEYKTATIVCSCGNEIETRSTQEEIHVEICSVCHPFYTGRQKLVDTAGRVERFKRKYGDVTGGDEDETPSEEAETESGEEAEASADDSSAEGEAATDGAPDEAQDDRTPRAVGASAPAAAEGPDGEDAGPDDED